MQIKKLWVLLLVPGIAILWYMIMMTLSSNRKITRLTKQKESEVININDSTIQLPKADTTGKVSIENALHTRRSVREFAKEPLAVVEISQLLWSAYGVTDSTSHPGLYLKTTPSAGALYPLSIYLVAGNIENLQAGLYKYKPVGHSLVKKKEGDLRKPLYEAALMQSTILEAKALILITCDYSKTTIKYDNRGKRYVHMEAGHAAQNVYLQGCGVDVGVCVIGAFSDELVSKKMSLPQEETPLYIVAMGRNK